MKPFVNLNDITKYEHKVHGVYQEHYAPISEKIGAQKLGYSVVIVEPGHKVCPFHNHRVTEEMFLILEGEGLLRFGGEEYAIKTHDIIACPAGGREFAHQIVNTSDKDIRYLCLSTVDDVDVCEYPDSDKVMSMVGSPQKRDLVHMSRSKDAVDYFYGEE